MKNMKLLPKSVGSRKYFKALCKLTEDELLYGLNVELEKIGCNDVIVTKDYILSHGNIPVMLFAHLDTVHREIVSEIVDDGYTISSPQGIGGDDRCGVFMVLNVVKKLQKFGMRPYVCFTTEEEVGGIGVSRFIKDYPVNEFDVKFLIEFDRANANDMVFYDCINKDWIDYVGEKTGLKEAFGSYTDICDVMSAWQVVGVNISCGYYKAHTLAEYVDFYEMWRNINKVVDWLKDEKFETRFEYIEDMKNYGYLFGYKNYEDYVYENGYNEYDIYDEDNVLVGKTGKVFHVCMDCGALITEDEYHYTMKEFGTPLCTHCSDYYRSYIDEYNTSYYEEKLKDITFDDLEDLYDIK